MKLFILIIISIIVVSVAAIVIVDLIKEGKRSKDLIGYILISIVMLLIAVWVIAYISFLIL